MIHEENSNTKFAIWFFQKTSYFKPVSNQEKIWAKELSSKRSKEYLFARGCLRESLSNLLKIEPLEIPLEAPPGKAPILKNDLGYISISHCKNSLLLGWSKHKIGLDIEINSRIFNHKLLAKKFFFEKEIIILNDLDDLELRDKILSMWVIKEAAIKCQKGSVFRDLKNWNIVGNKVKNYYLNKELNINLIDYRIWKIGIVIENNIPNNYQNPIICIN